MKRKSNNAILYFMLPFIFIACTRQDQPISFQQISLAEWDNETLRALRNHCRIDTISYIGPNEPPGLRFDNILFANAEGQIMHWLKYRSLFLETMLSSNIHAGSATLKVIEMYEGEPAFNPPVFLLPIEEGRCYKFYFKNQVMEVSITQIDQYWGRFDDYGFINQVNMVLEGMWITSTIEKQNDKINYNTINITLF